MDEALEKLNCITKQSYSVCENYITLGGGVGQSTR